MTRKQFMIKIVSLMSTTILTSASIIPSTIFANEVSDFPVSNIQENTDSIDSWMPDKKLQTAVSTNLKIAPEALTQNDMLKLTSFDAPISGITSLKGLEYAVNLNADVNLNHNSISDISPLYSTKIYYLRLAGNNITDVSQFLNMARLTTLVVPNNHIRDLSSLEGSQFTTIIATDQTITLTPQEAFPKQLFSTISGVGRPGGGKVASFSGVSSYDSNSDTLSWQLDGSKPNKIYANWNDRSWIQANYNAKGTGSAGFSGKITQPISYKADTASDVTVNYVDEDGKAISGISSQTISGNVGDSYDASTDKYKLAIDGYTLDATKLPTNATGTLSKDAQSVTYIYSMNVTPIIMGTVLVKYVDTDGNSISQEIVKSGNIGEGYITEKKIIDGYSFKEVQGKVSGQYTDQVQTVTYVYTQNNADSVIPEPKPDDKEENKDNSASIISSDAHSLPKTGENEYLTMMSNVLGLILLVTGLLVSILRLKKVRK